MNYFMLKVGNLTLDISKINETWKFQMKLKSGWVYDIKLIKHKGTNVDFINKNY